MGKLSRIPGAYVVSIIMELGRPKLRSDCLLTPVIQPSLRVKDEQTWRNFVFRSLWSLYRLLSHARSLTINLSITSQHLSSPKNVILLLAFSLQFRLMMNDLPCSFIRLTLPFPFLTLSPLNSCNDFRTTFYDLSQSFMTALMINFCFL